MSFRDVMQEAGYVTVAEAAGLAGVHEATIRRALDSGELPETKHGRFRYIKRTDLAEHYSAPPIRARILGEPFELTTPPPEPLDTPSDCSDDEEEVSP